MRIHSFIDFLLLFLIWNAEAFQVQPSPSTKLLLNRATKAVTGALVSAALVWAPTLLPNNSDNHPAWADGETATHATAAHVTLQQLPPSSIDVQIRDLPVIGKLLSGTYSKIPDSITVAKPSIVIQSPTDKAKAIQNIVQQGHLEFDVSGIINTHLDVDVAADRAGVMTVRIASELIPKLPFKNLASFSTQSSPTGGRESPWNMVTNMGSGETYYYNEKTGLTQYERPQKFK